MDCQKAFYFALLIVGALLVALPLESKAQFIPLTTFELPDATLDEVDATVQSELASIQVLLKEKEWNEALDRLLNLQDASANQLVPLGKSRYITLRQHCQRLIGELPEPCLKLYRARVNALAKDWFQKGIAERDANRLQHVVDSMFCSNWG